MKFKDLFYLGIFTLLLTCNTQDSSKKIITEGFIYGLDTIEIEEVCYDGVVYLINKIHSNKFSSVKFNRSGYIQTCDGDK